MSYNKSQDKLRKIAIYYNETKIEEENIIDDITWNDLEMDDVFLKINQTKSYIGEQVLYKRLHEPDTSRNWNKYEMQIKFLEENEKKRLQVEEKLSAIGKREEDYSLPVFLLNANMLKVQNGFLYHLLQMLLAFFGIGAFLSKHPAMEIGAILIVVINLCIYIWAKQRYEVFWYALGSVKQLVLFCKMMVQDKAFQKVFHTSEIEEAVHSLKKLANMICNFQVRKAQSFSGDIVALFQDYLLGITLYDVSVFNHLMKIIDGKQEQILKLYEFAGEIDIEIAVADFRKNLPHSCIPEFQENAAQSKKNVLQEKIQLKQCYHPLLEHPVCNDFRMEDNSLITGANASGKSTFMKAVAVNVIMAQTINTCAAKAAKIQEMDVMTSMDLRDDILSGESYYVRELKYLKRMVERANEKKAVLYVIDEILKGTNTKERLLASEAVLRYFMKRNCAVLVATHDMELVEKMKSDYACYYFESQIQKENIVFDYCLHKGIGGASNAIALLRYFDYPKEILDYIADIQKVK